VRRRRVLTGLVAVASTVGAVGACGGGDAGEPVVLLAAGDVGAAPFTSPAADPPTRSLADFAAAVPDVAVDPDEPLQVGVRRGDEPRLFAADRGPEVCDRARLAASLQGAPSVATAFAAAVGVDLGELDDWVGTTTAVVLTGDVRITAHRYDAGVADAYQAVLQRGTAVLIDELGQPTVRCLSGGPLAQAEPVRGEVRFEGEPWRGFRAADLSTIAAAPDPVERFVLADVESGADIERPAGDAGEDAAID
jgi:hypothetical protein